MKTPRTVQLPSGAVVALAPRAEPMPTLARERGAPLFSEVLALPLDLRVDGEPRAIEDLALKDFHALRAIATKLGWLAEETITIDCLNCGAAIEHAPCAAMELGPFVDRELDDPELDRTRAPGEPERIEGVGEVVLLPRTAREAAPLFRALRRRRFVISAGFVRGMGIARAFDLTEPAKIAARLERASDVAFAALGDLYLATHYPPRLFSIAICPSCGARNDVDAPFERELEAAGIRGKSAASNGNSFPTFDAFDARAGEIAREVLGEHEESVTLVVEGGVPACDDGGDPLLGAYDPPYEGDMTRPSRAPTITVFYRTFRAIWDDEGAYDWDAELRETIVHELEHHEGQLAGHDPMDEEERQAIADEVARVVGKTAIVRGSATALGTDLRDFMRRTWPLWLLVAVAMIVAIVFGR